MLHPIDTVLEFDICILPYFFNDKKEFNEGLLPAENWKYYQDDSTSKLGTIGSMDESGHWRGADEASWWLAEIPGP